MRKLFVFLAILLVMVQFGGLAEEAIGFENDEEIIATEIDQKPQETTTELTDPEDMANSTEEDRVVDQTASGEQQVIEESSQQEDSPTNSMANEQPVSDEQPFTESFTDEMSEFADTSFEDQGSSEESEASAFLAEAEATTESAPLQEQDMTIEPESMMVNETESPKILAESSGFTAQFIELSGKKAYATLDKGMAKYIDLGDEYGSRWRSSNKKVATVSSEGLVTCKARGTTKITVTAKQKRAKHGQERTLVLKVVDPLDPSELYIYDGMQNEVSHGIQYSHEYSWRVVPGFRHQMEVTVVPEGSNKNVTWKSSNKKVVSITKSGYMTALKPGTARLTVKSDNGLSAWMDVIVQKNQYTGVHNIDKGLAYCLEDGSVRIYLKSLNVVNNKRVDAVFYLCNGTKKKIRKLRNVTLTLNCGYPEYNNGASNPFLSKRISKIRVSCKGERWTTFKVRFVGKEILDPEWFLDNADIIVEDEYNFSY